MNIFMVGMTGDDAVFVPQLGRLSRQEALNLAAWLVVVADAQSVSMEMPKIAGRTEPTAFEKALREACGS